MAHAIIDPEAAWAEAQQLSSYDDGNTKSNTLYWIGTRPGSNDCPDCTTRPPQPTDQPTDKPTTHPPVDGCDCHPGGTTVDPRFKKRFFCKIIVKTYNITRCHDCGNDPWGCLGCQACGTQDCRSYQCYECPLYDMSFVHHSCSLRFCGFDSFIDIPC